MLPAVALLHIFFHSRIQAEALMARRARGPRRTVQSDLRTLPGPVCTHSTEPKPAAWPKHDHWVDGEQRGEGRCWDTPAVWHSIPNGKKVRMYNPCSGKKGSN